MVSILMAMPHVLVPRPEGRLLQVAVDFGRRLPGDSSPRKIGKLCAVATMLQIFRVVRKSSFRGQRFVDFGEAGMGGGR